MKIVKNRFRLIPYFSLGGMYYLHDNNTGKRVSLETKDEDRPYAEYRDYALNETPFINPKAMLEHLKQTGKVHVNWRGPAAKRGFQKRRSPQY